MDGQKPSGFTNQKYFGMDHTIVKPDDPAKPVDPVTPKDPTTPTDPNDGGGTTVTPTEDLTVD